MQIPIEDIADWRSRLRQGPPSVVLREIAKRYALNRSALGMELPDLSDGVFTPHVQAVWTWDFERKGSGLSDEQLNQELASLTY